MQSGQTFVVDAEAETQISTFYKKPLGDIKGLGMVGSTYSIAKGKNDGAHAITPLEVKASKWTDGKPQKGRPRSFPRHVVARLLGELTDPSLTNPLVTLVLPTPEPSDEEATKVAQAALAAATPIGVSNTEPAVAASANSAW